MIRVYCASAIAGPLPVGEWRRPTSQKENTLLAKPNYAFEKRKRELEQKRKKEEKLARKMQNKQAKAGEGGDAAPAPEPDSPPA